MIGEIISKKVRTVLAVFTGEDGMFNRLFEPLHPVSDLTGDQLYKNYSDRSVMIDKLIILLLVTGSLLIFGRADSFTNQNINLTLPFISIETSVVSYIFLIPIMFFLLWSFIYSYIYQYLSLHRKIEISKENTYVKKSILFNVEYPFNSAITKFMIFGYPFIVFLCFAWAALGSLDYSKTGSTLNLFLAMSVLLVKIKFWDTENRKVLYALHWFVQLLLLSLILVNTFGSVTFARTNNYQNLFLVDQKNEVNFNDKDLRFSNFSSSTLKGIDFRNSIFVGSMFKSVKSESLCFTSTYLYNRCGSDKKNNNSEDTVEELYVNRCELPYNSCQKKSKNKNEANLCKQKKIRCKNKYISLMSTMASQFGYTDLRDAVFSKADMRYVKMHNSDLQRADFSDANLKNAFLVNTDIRRTNFSKTNLKNANFCGAQFDRREDIPVEILQKSGVLWGAMIYTKKGNFIPVLDNYGLEKSQERRIRENHRLFIDGNKDLLEKVEKKCSVKVDSKRFRILSGAYSEEEYKQVRCACAVMYDMGHKIYLLSWQSSSLANSMVDTFSLSDISRKLLHNNGMNLYTLGQGDNREYFLTFTY